LEKAILQKKEYEERMYLQKKIEIFKTQLMTLPKIYRDMEDLYGDMEIFLPDIDKSLYLFGPTGIGKTVIATMILRERWRQEKHGIYWNYMYFILKCQMNAPSRLSDLEFNMEYPHLLVIDDFGREYSTDYIRSIGLTILDYRTSHGLQTIVTSNRTLTEIDDKIDKRITSRLCEHFKIIEINRDDRRIKKV